MQQKHVYTLFSIVLAISLLSACAPTTAPAAVQPAATIATVATVAAEPAAVSTETSAAASAVTATVAVDTSQALATTTDALAFDTAAWNYDSDNDVYWQIEVAYATGPQTTAYESLGIYVPGAYLSATANGDGTFTATINETGNVNGYTAMTAPMVFPVNTPGYAAQQPPTAYNYDEVSSYLDAGFVYVAAGMRGRNNGYDDSGNLTFSGGAPWGVTDFKAAVRYIRYNQDLLPGSTDNIFAFGMSGGGAQTAIIGASGDSQLYYPYLESIGAAMHDANGEPISDAVAGAMAWCPITSLDYADAAYEWNMGQYVATETRADGTFTSVLSDDLASSFAEYINQLGIKDEDGNVLALQPSDDGIYAAGSYYDYLLATVTQSLNNFLVDTTFPYTETSGGPMGAGGFPGGALPQGGELPAGDMPAGDPPAGAMAGADASSSATPTTYQTVQAYIDALNADGEWVTYDDATNTATITSLAGFVNSQKNPSKSVAAFDGLDRGQGENYVFGNDESDALHFNAGLAALLAENQSTYAQYADWDASYVDAYANDLLALDSLGNGIQSRMNAYNPMYYLLPYYEGYQTSTVAKYWRINTGIKQGDTANTVEMNLALALENFASVQDVEFTTVWGQGHTMAERTGDSTSNFIAWVVDITGQ